MLIDTPPIPTVATIPNSGEHRRNRPHVLGIPAKIDYLITHRITTADHIGGLEGVLKRIPIGTFIDHGENREIRGTQGPGGMI